MIRVDIYRQTRDFSRDLTADCLRATRQFLRLGGSDLVEKCQVILISVRPPFWAFPPQGVFERLCEVPHAR